MATKLKNLAVTKVDFVDEGANPDSHIRLFKHRDGTNTTDKGAEGERHGVLKRLVAFIAKAAGMEQEEINSALDEIQKGDSVSFSEKINEVNNRKIADEIWDTCYALQSSLCSILNDEELDSESAAAAMQESLGEFQAVVQEAIVGWSGGRVSGIVKNYEETSQEELELMKAAVKRLNETIEKTQKKDGKKEESREEKTNSNETPKGDEEEMKIDKSKLTPAEQAFLESIEKRYGETGTEGQDSGTEGQNSGTEGQGFGTLGTGVEKASGTAQPTSATAKSVQAGNVEPPAQQADETDNIYKGLHPAVAAELESLKKFKQEAEDRELSQVAKKYAIIGKKEVELVPMFKSLKAAGGTAYNDMIAVLDLAVDTVEKSGAFSEIGKSGHGGSGNAAEAKISGIAKSYMEKDPALSYHAAVAKAWEDNPDILGEYEEEADF